MKYKTEKLRIDKYLGNMGVGSRSEIKRYIKNKRVMVNGVYITDNGLLINLYDDIKFDEQSVIYKKFIYIMMNKPQGVISATEDNHQETVIDLLDEKYLHYEMFPTGRLDKDTEGLLLLTNNGTLAHNMLSPKKHVEKKYYVEIHGDLKEKDIKSFSSKIELDDGYVCMPAKLEIIESDEVSKAYVTIKEGKFHQIKRMFETLNKEVIYLKRLTMGPLELDEDLDLGEYRELNDEEMALIASYM